MVYILPPEFHGRAKGSGIVIALETFQHNSSDRVGDRGHEARGRWSFYLPAFCSLKSCHCLQLCCLSKSLRLL